MDWAVSVIVPFCNAEGGLARCLESLLAQRLGALEIILVDDASTDASPEIAAQYARQEPRRIRCLRQAVNMGPGAARNVGMAVARGEYVGFVDADDMAGAEMFLSLYTAARRAGAQMAVCGMREVRDGVSREVLPGEIGAAGDLLKNSRLLPSPWNKIYRRDYLAAVGAYFPPSRMSEDMAFAFKVLVNEPQLACVNEALYVYMKNTSSLTLDMSKRKDAFISIADLKNYLEQNGKIAEYRKQYAKACFLHLFYYPACLLVIDSLIKGRNRWQTLRQAPRYAYDLLKFLSRRSV